MYAPLSIRNSNGHFPHITIVWFVQVISTIRSDSLRDFIHLLFLTSSYRPLLGLAVLKRLLRGISVLLQYGERQILLSSSPIGSLREASESEIEEREEFSKRIEGVLRR
jgi:hypothetical protein